MGSEREQVLANVFWAVAGEGWQGVLAQLLGLPLEEEDGGAAAGVTINRAGAQTQTRTTSTSKASGTSGSGGTLNRVLSYTTLGAAPLVKGLIGLFTGGDKREAQPVLTEFALPPRVAFETAMGDAGLEGADYDQFGMPRRVRVSEGAARRGGEPAAWHEDTASGAPQITVQVQAMDSRSFLDHSDEIARAVREAMLNMHPLNDVVSDL